MAGRQDTDTLTRAEEQALARARRAVDGRTGGRGSPRARSGSSGRRRSSGSRRGTARGAPARLPTLDVLRGLGVIATVVFLAGTAPSSLPPWAQPSAWHGIVAADLVLPLFLVVAGAALAASDAQHAGAPRWRRTFRVLRRLTILLAAGLVLNWLADPDLATLRWTGLLQRVALATVLAGALTRLPRTWAAAAGTALLAGWWWVLERVGAPGVGAGVLRPDENVVAWADATLIGPAHLAAPTDPLGLVTTVPAALLVVAGWALGGWLRVRPPGPATAAALTVAGGWLVVGGVIAAQVTPLNPTLWTPPYLLFATGMVLGAAGLVHLAVEVLPGRRLLARVEQLGQHAFPAYVLAAGVVAAASRPLADGRSAWSRLVEGFAAPVFGTFASLVLAGVLLAVVSAVVSRLDARGWHLRA